MTRIRRWIGVAAFVGLVLLVIAWQVFVSVAEMPMSAADPMPPTCETYIDSAFRGALPLLHSQAAALINTRRIPGLAIAVWRDGRLVYHEGFGYANIDRRTPACPSTRFRAASLSKLFTAAAMARLAERHQLALDAPIQEYVPEFPDKGATITPEMLASHRAGIRAYHDDSEAINTRHYANVIASLERFANDSLVARPGTRFVYSNYGYVLLGAAIERASGQDFLIELRNDVFAPLGMSSTVPEDTARPIPGRAQPYDTETPYSPDGSLVRSPYNDFSAKWASGGFLSTVDDLCRFGTAFMRSRGYLLDRTIHMLMRPRSGLPPLAGYGLGWITASDLHFRRVHFQFGASSGGTSVLAIYPGSDVAVAVMANLGHAKFPFAALTNIAKPFLR